MAELINQLDSYLSNHPLFIILLLGTGIFFTLYLRFPQIRFFKKAIRVVRGKDDDKDKLHGDATHFQALSTALSGTVGTGNIAGVALAIHLGGPAALFWMLVTAAIGMTTKMVEVTLSHKYRATLPDGTIAGGPMYYMKERLNFTIKGTRVYTGTVLAVLFSLFTFIGSFGTGCLPQINSISLALGTTFGIPSIITGIVLSFVLGLVILGGVKRIVKVTSKIVPFMAIAYFIGALIVIIYHIDNLLPAISSIFTDVFTGTAASGGFLGSTVAIALSKGVGRGLFSNEAGQGSAPIAHAAARCDLPAKEGLVALLEPFIDTIVICTLTGLMILTSGVWKEKFTNDFQYTDIEIIKSPSNSAADIRAALASKESRFNGTLDVDDGWLLTEDDVYVIHSNSIAENIMVRFASTDEVYHGLLIVKDGKPQMMQNTDRALIIRGNSLIHSAPLTLQAFSSSWFGEFGAYIVAIALLLFAFSTTIAWSYYGDRAASFLFGHKAIVPFRIVYIIVFFIGSITDTTIVWAVASIGIVLMAVPNLIGLLILHKEVKEEIDKIE